MTQRLLLMFALAALPAFPVAKEILQLQRDLALLQEQVRTLQKSLDERMAVSQQLMNQNLEAANRLSTALAMVEKTVHAQEKVLVAPVANVGSRVESLATQFQALREAVEDVNSKFGKLQQQVLDIKNIVSALPPPAPAPSVGQGTVTQVSAESLFQAAMKDYQASNYNLAGPQFTEYVKLFPNTEGAGDAQYYLGEIFYLQAQYDDAVKAYDEVLQRFSESKQAPNALYKKGMSMLRMGRRGPAETALREVIQKHPRSPAASQAKEALAGLGVKATAPAKPKGK